MQTFLKKHPYIAIIISFGILFLIGNNLAAVTDTTESNYVLTAKEMLTSGDFFSPVIFGNYWYDKPIFYYWELLLSFSLFGISEWSARLPGGVFAVASLCYLYWFASKVYDRKIATVAVILLGTSFEFWFLSKSIITDLSLFLFMSVTIGSFYLGYRENRNYYFLCYVASALAVLTKGPIGLLLPGLAIFIFLILRKKDYKEIAHVHMLSGFAIFLFLALPWYGYMYVVHGSDFLLNFFGVHNFLRATVSEHGNAGQWWYYIMIYLVGFCPWSFIALPLFWKKRKALTLKHMDELTEYLLIWAVTVIIAFTLMATKYTTYTFPSLFAISLLLAKLFREKTYFVMKVGGITAAVYLVLTFAVVPPVTYMTSGKGVGNYIAQMNIGDRKVIYERKYRTSTAFYSGYPIESLSSIKEIENSRPGTLSWDAKNVMPFYAKEKLNELKDGYILIIPPNRSDVKGITKVVDISYKEGKEVKKIHELSCTVGSIFKEIYGIDFLN